ncbi:MAG: rod shape-determining protein MreC [Alphaproteobacteria bacterium]|nr:rod shape-determining protein MreC [Alphaproteobacteria bacterium]MBQ8660574.1 rod shape-determining protein MreC [Alphaproteobacteria bacterium]
MNKLSTSKAVKIQMIKKLVRKIFVIMFIVFSFILIFIGKPDNVILNRTSGVVADVMSPFVKVISYPIYLVGSFIVDVKNFRDVDARNHELRTEISKLKEQLNYFKQIEVENQELRKLNNFKTNAVNYLLSTRVLGSSGSGFTHSFLVDAGAKEGVKKYQGVLVDGYLVGQINSVGTNYSRMILISDANSKIPVQIERTKTRAFLIGDNTDYPQVVHFENQEPVQIGDVVVTSGMGGNLPAGIPVGIIGSISEDNGIIIQPFVHKSNIDYIKVIKTSHTDGIKNFLIETNISE